MANGADGSIRIDTELDNSGFEKGSDKLLNALKSLESTIETIGDNLSGGLDTVIKSLQSLSSQATDTNQQVTNTANQATAANQRMAQSAQQATGAMASGAKGAGQSMGSLEKETGKLLQKAEGMKDKLATPFKTQGEANKYRENLAAMERQLEAARQKVADFGNTKFTNDALEKAERDCIKLENELLKLDKIIRQIDAYEKGGSSYWPTKALEQYGGTGAGARKAYEKMLADYEALQAKRDRIVNASPMGEKLSWMGSETADFERMNANLDATADRANACRDAIGGMGGQHPILSALATSAQKVGSAFLSMAKNAAVTVVRKLGSALRSVASSAKKAASGLIGFGKTTKACLSPVDSLVHKLTSFKTMFATRIKRTLMGSIFSSLKEGMQQFAQFSESFNTAMSNITNTSGQIGNQIASLVGSIITAVEPVITRILSLVNSAITALSALFAFFGGKSTVAVATKGTKDYASAVGDAAGEQKKFNAELYGWDELNKQQEQNSGGGGAGGGDAGPLWEEVPIEDVLPDSLKSLAEKMKKAIAKNDWEGVGRVIAEGINLVVDKVDDWILKKFEPAAVKWAGRIASVLNGITDGVNWKKIGKTAGDGFNAIIRAANTFFDKFRAKKFGRAIGTAVKSWFDTVDWKAAGRAFANKWNTLFQMIEGFVTTPGIWTSIGKSIGTFVKNWFATIDLNSIATTIISLFNGVRDMIKAFLDQKPFEGLGLKIANAINRVLHEVDWAGLATTLSDLFITLLDVIWEAVENIDWEALGQAIGEFLGNIDWVGVLERVAKIIWTAFTGVLKGLLSTDGGRMFLALFAAIKGLKLAFTLGSPFLKKAAISFAQTGISGLSKLPSALGGIGSKVSAGLSGIASKISAAAPAIGTAALAAFDAVMIAYDTEKLVEAAQGYEAAQEAHNHETETALSSYAKLYQEKGKEVADQWAQMVYQIDTTNMSFDEAQQALTGKIEGYWDGVPQNMWDGFKAGWNDYFGEGGSGLFGLLGDAFTGVVDWVKGILGIHSPSTVFYGIASDLVAGLKNGLEATWGSIKSFFTESFSNIKESVSSAWQTIKTKTSETWSSIKTGVSTAVSSVKTGISTAWTNIKTATSTTWSNIKSGISTAWTNIKSTVTGSTGSVKSTVSSAWSNVKSTTSSSFENMRSTISSKLSSAKTSLDSHVASMKERTLSDFGAMKTTVDGKMEGVRSTVQTKMDQASGYVKGMSWEGTGSNLINGFWNGIKNVWSSVSEWVSNAAQSLTNTIKDVLQIHSPSRVWYAIGVNLDQGLIDGMNSAKKKVVATASAIAKSTNSSAKKKKKTTSNKLQFTSDADLTRLDIIRSRLMDIASIMNQIAKTVSSMGGLQIPQIASGTVIPYKVAASSMASTGNDAGYDDSYTNGEILQILANIRDYLAEIENTDNREIKVMIDGREVFNAVVNENNRAIKRTGGVSPLKV